MIEYEPSQEEIAAMCAKIRAENAIKRQGKKPQPVVDPDCDAELERQADAESRRRGSGRSPPPVYRMPQIEDEK